MPADSLDEYLKIGESTAVDSLQSFCRGVISIFEAEYLRKPNEADTARLLHVGNQRGFPGMLGSLDCMHWQWDKCPTAYHGFFSGRSGKPTIVLEAVASSRIGVGDGHLRIPACSTRFRRVLPISDDFPTTFRRYQVQRLLSSNSGDMKGAMESLVKIVHSQGWRQLFSGLSINYLKVVPSVAIGFTVYDVMKSFLRVPSRDEATLEVVTNKRNNNQPSSLHS